MIFKTLQDTSIEDLTAAFNAAFKNYFVTINFTPEQLLEKFKVDGVKLNLSIGAFEENKLIGFIFHGTNDDVENLIAYNAGTGVVPEYRGKHLVTNMYEFIFPVLKDAEVKKIVLEAITENEKAIRVYKRLNFSITRKVDCYKGSISMNDELLEHIVLQKDEIDNAVVKSFWDFQPAWQNSFYAIEKQPENITNLIVEKEDRIVGYLILNHVSGRIMQFAAHKAYRMHGIGTVLFRKAAELKKELMLINIDNEAKTTSVFLKSLGFKQYISQYEMELSL